MKHDIHEDYVLMIYSFTTCVEGLKHVDDTTLFEAVNLDESSKPRQAADKTLGWTSSNNLELNANKSKESS